MNRTAPDPNQASKDGTHGACVPVPLYGWRVCLTSGRAGLAVCIAAADRIRAVICETATRTPHTTMMGHVHRVLSAGFGVGDTMEALADLLAKRSELPAPGPALTLIDLRGSGRVEIASRIAPPVHHVFGHGEDRLLPGLGNAAADVSDADWLAALSPSFVELIPVDILADLPSNMDRVDTPCRLRDLLLKRCPGDAEATGLAPPLVIANRVAPLHGDVG